VIYLKKLLLLFTTLVLSFSFLATANVAEATYVNGYYKSNGTYVNGYYRSRANAYTYDNYSYTGPSASNGYGYNNSYYYPYNYSSNWYTPSYYDDDYDYGYYYDYGYDY
jgi:hypothetical protein